MYTIDDPMIALILRFVGHGKKVTVSDHDFIQVELKVIQEHLKKFPPEDQGSRAIEWIEEHARGYRERWLKEVLGETFSSQGCPDCPLSEIVSPEHCQIHQEWLELLQQYAADEINSRIYVESSLKLLARHKEDLKVELSLLQEAG